MQRHPLSLRTCTGLSVFSVLCGRKRKNPVFSENFKKVYQSGIPGLLSVLKVDGLCLALQE